MRTSVPTIGSTANSARSRWVTDRVSLGRGVLTLIERLELAWQVARERRALQALDDRALKDLGLTRSDVYRESGRRVWDVPERDR